MTDGCNGYPDFEDITNEKLNLVKMWLSCRRCTDRYERDLLVQGLHNDHGCHGGVADSAEQAVCTKDFIDSGLRASHTNSYVLNAFTVIETPLHNEMLELIGEVESHEQLSHCPSGCL